MTTIIHLPNEYLDFDRLAIEGLGRAVKRATALASKLFWDTKVFASALASLVDLNDLG